MWHWWSCFALFATVATGHGVHHYTVTAEEDVAYECPRACAKQPIFVIEGGDENAAFATLFYLYVVNGVRYAWHKGYIPLIQFNPDWTKRTLNTQEDQTGVPLWERFFEPYCPNSTRLARVKRRCEVPMVYRERDFWYPQVHAQFAWSVRAWHYAKCPSQCTSRMKCDERLWRFLCRRKTDTTYDEGMHAYWRTKAHGVVKRVHRPKQYVTRRVKRVWRRFNPDSRMTLAVHARGTDKKHGRRMISSQEFRVVTDSFFRTFHDGLVYVATEDEALATGIKKNDDRIFVRSLETRSTKQANFQAHAQSQMQVAFDVLVDILLMAKCKFIVHGASAVSEAAIYTNIALHNNSVNLEYSGSKPHMPWSREYLIWKEDRFVLKESRKKRAAAAASAAGL